MRIARNRSVPFNRRVEQIPTFDRIRNIMHIRLTVPAGLLSIAVLAWFGDLPGQAPVPDSGNLHPGDPLPFDTEVVKGRLGNGLTYYIKENHKPENRAQVWLVVNAGSVLENEDQLGLAHFTEHMAFNGTEAFAKHEIIDFLESIGMKFGPEINAYTGFDETVYMLQLPTDSAGIMEKGLEILYQWACKISFEEEEIDKERGVVIEEWRLGRGARMRMLDKQIPVILKGSRYPDRLPIGNKAVLEAFAPESLKRYYRDWYRPDLMAVIAVGDFDRDTMVDRIRGKFSTIPAREGARSREVFPVPDHEETLYAIATDPEASETFVSLYVMHDILPENTVRDYRRMLTERLFSRMLNHRLYELLNQADPPYLYAFVLNTNLVRSKGMYSLNVGVSEDGILRGLETVLTEAARVRKFGFTGSELERTKTWMIRQMDQVYMERDKTESHQFASEYRRNFLENEPVPGITYEYNFVKEHVPGIILEEVNRLANTWLAKENRVVLLNAPEKDSLEIPGETVLASLLGSVEGKDVEPYVDLAGDEPLLEALSGGADILSESRNDDLGTLTWALSNGMEIILKSTDFKNDEILFHGFSVGGNSLVRDGQYRSSSAAADIVSISGLGKYDLNALNKKLTGKMVSVFPYINELTEGITGHASPRDVETMFQLIYLYLTRPRKDTSAYLSYKTRMQGFIENRYSDPESAFYDTLQVTLSNHHYRRRPWSMELLEEIDFDDYYSIYRDRFSDMGDFTFVFVGNFDPDSIRPLIVKYLGNLPSAGREETWRDIGVENPRGIVEKTVERGLEPRSLVSLHFTGDYEWSRENNYALNSMASVLRIKLREILREDLSGTYGVSVSASPSLYPREEYRISISFGCSPDRTEELTGTVFEVIDSLRNFTVEPSYVTKVSEAQKRSFETSIRQNQFWLSSLVRYAFLGQDPDLILEYPQLVNSLDAEQIKDAAGRYFDTGNYVLVVLRPAATDDRTLPAHDRTSPSHERNSPAHDRTSPTDDRDSPTGH